MIKINKEKFEKYKDNLERQLKLYYKYGKIKTYEDVFKILCISLRIGVIDNSIKRYECDNHIILFATYGYNSHRYHMMTFLYNYIDDIYEIDMLESILNNKDENKIIGDLMTLCITLLDNTINPYNILNEFAIIK